MTQYFKSVKRKSAPFSLELAPCATLAIAAVGTWIRGVLLILKSVIILLISGIINNTLLVISCNYKDDARFNT